MVGLSIVLEAQKSSSSKNNIMNHHQVISKTSMIITTTKNDNKISSSSSPSSSSSSVYNNRSFMAPTFLDQCFLCHQKLLPGKDIYMYKGDRAFCSVECRCRQIFMDEEESILKDNCSLAAIKPTSSSSSPSSRHRKGSRNRAGGFAC